MKYRPLGDSGLTVSEIGFGGWGIGGRTDGLTSYGETDDAISLAAIDRALALGITFFDTSSVYGYGHSEELIGEALGGRREAAVVATKAGFVAYDREPDYTPAHIRASLKGSLKRLKSDYVDLLQLHNPSPEQLLARPEIFAALEALKAEGLIRAHGVSVKAPVDGLAILERFAFDAVQANLNMMDLRLIECGLLDRARKVGTGIVVRTPLCFGFLSGAITRETRFPPGDHRNLWPRAQVERWIEGAKALGAAVPAPDGQSPGQVAIRFCLSVPGIASVIPGILTPAEAEANAAASALGPLPDAAVDAVRAVHARMSFFVGGGD